MALPVDYEERVYAGVLGKLIGVYLGRPFEGWDHARIMRELGPITDYVHERFGVPLVVTDDDVAGTFTFVRALEDHGFDPALNAAGIGETWLNYIVEQRTILWWGGMGRSTEETAWRRLRAGVPAPASGSIATNGATVAEQIGAQIFIDAWAMVCPGNPGCAAHLAREAGRVSHDGEAVHAAVLIAVMEALAFVEADMDRLLDAGLAAIPGDCLVARLAGDVRRWCVDHPDWMDTRALIADRYGYHRYPGNCHVIPNHAVVLMALLYGRDDFGRAMMIANTAGWDTDCNAGNVGCLMGIRLGLAGLDARAGGTDWRGPIADRVILSTADGGNAITDAVRVAERLARIGRRLAGEAELKLPKDGARFHFSQPGSVQGFVGRRADGTDASFTVAPVLRDDGSRCLALRFRDLRPGHSVAAETPTFMPPDVGLMRTYDLLASPALNPGQRVRAHVLADQENRGAGGAALTLLVYGADDALERITAEPVSLPVGGEATISWRVPDLKGRPIAAVGVSITTAAALDGTVYLDWFDWDGVPDLVLRRPEKVGTFWHRAWVDAVSLFASTDAAAFHLSQNEGVGLLIYGTREWADMRVDSEVVVHLGSGGLAVCVQGLRRYYVLLLRWPNHLVLLQAWDGTERVLGKTEFTWDWEQPVRLGLGVRDGVITGEAGGGIIFAVEDHHRPLSEGAVALAVETGAISTSSIAIRPA